jgi:hypothetical protein
MQLQMLQCEQQKLMFDQQRLSFDIFNQMNSFFVQDQSASVPGVNELMMLSHSAANLCVQPERHNVNDNNENSEHVGKRKAVWWNDENSYYMGTVSSTRKCGNKLLFHVKYDDGDEDWESSVENEDDVMPLLCTKHASCGKLRNHVGRCRGQSVIKKSSAPTCRDKDKHLKKRIRKLGDGDGWLDERCRDWTSSRQRLNGTPDEA